MLFRKAADQGYSQAQFNLGAMYKKDLEVPKNTAKALSWHRKAAVQAHQGALTCLAEPEASQSPARMRPEECAHTVGPWKPMAAVPSSRARGEKVWPTAEEDAEHAERCTGRRRVGIGASVSPLFPFPIGVLGGGVGRAGELHLNPRKKEKMKAAKQM